MEPNSDQPSDLLAGASFTSFLAGDFDNLNFEENCEKEETNVSRDENAPTEEDRAPQQEGTGETTLSCSFETKDTFTVENVDKDDYDAGDDEEDFAGARFSRVHADRATEENYTCSSGDTEQDASAAEDSEVDEEKDTGTEKTTEELFVLESWGDEFCCGDKGEHGFSQASPQALETDENLQVIDEEQDESEGEEEGGNVGRFPEPETLMKSCGTEEVEHKTEEIDEVEAPDSECEITDEKEDNFLAQCLHQIESLYGGGSTTVTSEFPSMSVESLQELVVKADEEEYVEEMKEFLGEEHEEAVECFADYPSDFSSCEYLNEGVKNQESGSQSRTSDGDENAVQDIYTDNGVTDASPMGTEDIAGEREDGYLYSRDLEIDAERLMSFISEDGEKDTEKLDTVESHGESDKAGSNQSIDKVQVGKRDEGFSDMPPPDPEYIKNLENKWLPSASSPVLSLWSFSNESNISNSRVDPDWDLVLSKATSVKPEDLSSAEDKVDSEKRLSDQNAEDIDICSLAHSGDSKATPPSCQGSLDDSFFFHSGTEVTDLGQLEDDGNEEDRIWEQEQERINAFFEFYNDSEERNEEERQIKVQFCADQLSKVIHYDSDSDGDSLSSSTSADDVTSSEASDRGTKDTLQNLPGCGSSKQQRAKSLPKREARNKQICGRKHKCLNVLKFALKMGVLTAMGLLLFWMTRDQHDWMGQLFFHNH